MLERRNVKIRGSVQGVFFRETVRRIASHHKVAGFVRNAGADTVEIEAEGESTAVNGFVEEVLARPPQGAVITDVRSTLIPPQENDGFSIAPTIR